mmetsp:Transcript_38275/g.114324  ORF Transcript_38275/g.114324 Transcript_38275/m.114324 type:complete len:200 (+) Transcript_38275:56-655(+)
MVMEASMEGCGPPSAAPRGGSGAVGGEPPAPLPWGELRSARVSRHPAGPTSAAAHPDRSPGAARCAAPRIGGPRRPWRRRRGNTSSRAPAGGQAVLSHPGGRRGPRVRPCRRALEPPSVRAARRPGCGRSRQGSCPAPRPARRTSALARRGRGTGSDGQMRTPPGRARGRSLRRRAHSHRRVPAQSWPPKHRGRRRRPP